MKKIYCLSKKNISLAKQEVISLLQNDNYKIFENFLIAESKKSFLNRLAYTHSVYEFLFRSKLGNVNKSVKNFEWKKIIKNSYCIRTHNSNNKKKEKILADIIWNKIENPVVNLNNPNSEINFFFVKNNVLCGKLRGNTDKSYLSRKAHHRPGFHPTSLDPALARAMINITGKKRGALLDPFCGSGGILIEAGLMGFNITGFDIEKKMINLCKKNLDFYQIKNFNLSLHDSQNINKKFDCIVTDLPYGKNSKVENLTKTYLNFLKSAYNSANIIVIGFPDFINYNKLIGKTKWKIKNKFSVYLHKSLSKVIYLLKRV
ncbi:methyltransferase domain-containing protein [Candidatus Woesearchaeota archaeon]|nr:methyltransferase domain-containing protein [Candidatus Woesearchaeota archaeon]